MIVARDRVGCGHDTGPDRVRSPPSRPRSALADLRPQVYGNGTPTTVPDPIIEPLWVGVRALAAVDATGADLVDEEGDTDRRASTIIIDGARPPPSPPTGLVVDGFLTKQATQAAAAATRLVRTRCRRSAACSSASARNRAVDTRQAHARHRTRRARSFGDDDQVTFVATDLLWLDDTSLLDIPLLERRRLLESVLVESDVVRTRGVRPAADRCRGSARGRRRASTA